MNSFVRSHHTTAVAGEARDIEPSCLPYSLTSSKAFHVAGARSSPVQMVPCIGYRPPFEYRECKSLGARADQLIAGLCRRRQWPQPHFESYRTSAGYACVARVNNREYQTDTTYGSDLLARENAAMRAYLICRNFSVNDGMYPSGHARGPVLQGLPVAIGTERRSIYTEDNDASTSSGSRSGGSSPRSYVSYGSPRDSRGDSRRVSNTSRALRYESRRY